MIEFTGLDTRRKHRVHDWINIDKLEPLFGIQANVAYGKWAHVVQNGKPILFDTRAEAKAKIAEWSR